jgi:hypothetical protein
MYPEPVPLSRANEEERLRAGQVKGAVVLIRAADRDFRGPGIRSAVSDNRYAFAAGRQRLRTAE